MTDSDGVKEFVAAKSVTTDDVKAFVDQVWAELKKQETFKKDYPKLAAAPSPYSFSRPTNQFGVAETIAIAVVGGLLKDAAVGVWKEFIWPALQRKFGEDVSEKPVKDVDEKR
jgi:hypothetical protein